MMPCHFLVLSCKGVPGFLPYFQDAWKSVSNVKIADTLLVEAAIADTVALFCVTHFLITIGSSTAYSFIIMT